MKSTLIHNIRTLYQTGTQAPIRGEAMAQVPQLESAYLLIEGGTISAYGPMSEAPERADEVVDATGRLVLPAWCDSHTHLVFAGSREGEFVDRIRGLSYEEIARRGGGILNSARLLNETPEAALVESGLSRAEEILRMGTGAVEIKSGYGLTVEGELKMLRAARRIAEQTPLTVKTTFLGAHAFPLEYRENRSAYVDLVIEVMLPRVVDEGLADFVDVFCERGFFSVEDTDRILEAATRLGLRAKVHANELDYSGGVQAGVRHGAISVDHLEYTGPEEIEALLDSRTMPTLLPSTSFFLQIPYAPARTMIEAGLPVALATDYNPGSSPSGNMAFVQSLACLYLKMTPEEALHAATINSAYAMDVQRELGSIVPGKKANVIITRPLPALASIPYSFGSRLIEQVWLNGSRVE